MIWSFALSTDNFIDIKQRNVIREFHIYKRNYKHRVASKIVQYYYELKPY